MNKFLYSNIEFVHDLNQAESPATRIGLVTEWFDGTFWHVGLCGLKYYPADEYNSLDALSKGLLADPFDLLYVSIDNYYRKQDQLQDSYSLPKMLVKLFPTYVSIQARTLYEYHAGHEDSYDEIFKELSAGFEGVTPEAHWFRMPLNPVAKNEFLLD